MVGSENEVKLFSLDAKLSDRFHGLLSLCEWAKKPTFCGRALAQIPGYSDDQILLAQFASAEREKKKW